MDMTHRFAICCCLTALAALAGCAKGGDRTDTAAAVDTAPAATTAPPPASISLADVAGKWQMRSTPEGGQDTTATQYVLTATADTTGWTIAFPNRRQPVRLHVSVNGDSIMTRTEPYESARRKGVQAVTESVLRQQGSKLVGSTVAHYRTRGADSVLRLRSEGTRAP